MTYTVATLEISAAAFIEIASKLRQVGYDHIFMPDGSMDMHGIALAASEGSYVDRKLTVSQIEMLIENDIRFELLPDGRARIPVADAPLNIRKVTMNQTPATVGRVVHFHPTAGVELPTGYVPRGGQVLTAHVCDTLPDGHFVNLLVIDGNGSSFPATSVPHGTAPGHWDWMPFQKGQAGKVDELTPRIEKLEATTNALISSMKDGNELPKPLGADEQPAAG